MPSNSWRLTVDKIDKSSTVIGTEGSVGAMTIRAGKGGATPIFVDAGQEKRIIDLFGKPSVAYPDVWEAIQYNKQSGLWISAPYDATALLGGVLVSDAGSAVFGAGEDPSTIEDFTFPLVTDHFVIAAASPYVDDLGVLVSYNDTNSVFTIKLYKDSVLIETYDVSLVVGAKDGFGKNIYILDVLDGDDYIQAVVNPLSAITSFTDDTAEVAFSDGARGATITITELTLGWAFFQQSNTYKADIFMDPTAIAGVEALFDTLRSTYQKYASYILALPAGSDAASSITTKDGFSINNKGLAFYWNHAKVKDTYNNSYFWTSLIGRVGVKYAQMTNIFNGGAPAWIDENKHGGQLGAGIVQMEYDPSEATLQSLDEAGINPIVQYASYGVMITSQRTAQSPLSLSDTSWIAHARLFDYIISNMLKGVLTYQIVKLNDELHRRLAVSKGETLMDPILASGLLSDYIIQCDLNNNDGAARAARKFVYTLGIQVTPYSERIVLEFVNVGQTTILSEVIGV